MRLENVGIPLFSQTTLSLMVVAVAEEAIIKGKVVLFLLGRNESRWSVALSNFLFARLFLFLLSLSLFWFDDSSRSSAYTHSVGQWAAGSFVSPFRAFMAGLGGWYRSGLA